MNDTQIPPRWLPVIRVVWLALVILLLAIFVAGISPYFNELRVPCSEADCGQLALSPQEAQVLRDMGLSLESYAGYQVGLDIYGVVILIPLAGLIFWRRSDNWLGLLLSLGLVFFGTVTASNTAALARLYPILQWPSLLLDELASMLILLLFYLFPDGRFVPRWIRLIAIALIGSYLIDVLLVTRGLLAPAYSLVGYSLWLGSLLVGLLAQIYRYRHVSNATQRQQTKWVMFGLIIVFITALTWALLFELFPLQSGSTRLALNFGFGIAVLLFTILPVSIVISILRYRLWDIDIVINRTLVYGLLTGVLALLYFGTVVLLQGLFGTLSEQGSQLAIVASTLVIAALFNPLRRRIQRIVDRRFYRRKYDAVKTLTAFGAIARDEVDMDVLATALIYVVNETMQPAMSSLWLAPSPSPAGNRRTHRDD